jgi:hypothetical protein
VNQHSFASLKYDFEIYTDGYPFLGLRKVVVYLVGASNLIALR